MNAEYSAQYYDRISRGSRLSAAAILPLVVDLIKPASVVDIGCGTGAWLAEFKRRGVTDVLGLDGTHVDRSQLEIDPREYVATDLTQPLPIYRQFDLAVCLEVAEHLPEFCSNRFIESLTTLAPVILFSAAIPHQGGTHHLNEQWPAYWAERFAAHGLVALDPFRWRIWESADIDWWYRQNLVLFVWEEWISRSAPIAAMLEKDGTAIRSYVHPLNYLNHAWEERVLHVAVDIASITGRGDVIVVVDEDRFGPLYLPDREVRPFIERHGSYFGPPSDDFEAIAELERMKDEGAAFLAIGWPAFWWLDHYQAFAKHVETHFPAVLKNENVVIYRLRPASRAIRAT